MQMEDEYFVSTVESDELGYYRVSPGRRGYYDTVTTGRQQRRRTISKKLLEADFDDPEIQQLRSFQEAKTLAEREEKEHLLRTPSPSVRKKRAPRRPKPTPAIDASGLVLVVEGDDDEEAEEIVVMAADPVDVAKPSTSRAASSATVTAVETETESQVEAEIEIQPTEPEYEVVAIPEENLPAKYASVDGTFDIGSGIPIIGMEKLDLSGYPLLQTEDPDALPTFLLGGGFKRTVNRDFAAPSSSEEESESDDGEDDDGEQRQTRSASRAKKAAEQKPGKKRRHPFFDPDDYEWTPQLEQDEVQVRRGRTTNDYYSGGGGGGGGDCEDTPIFHCDNCNFQTLLKKEFVKHLQSHDTFGPKYQCEKCDFSTHNKSGFRKHRDVHTTKEMLQCDQCEFQTINSTALRRHIALHNSDTRLRCQKCSYTTPFRDELKKHKELHEPKLLRRCDECDYVTYDREELKRHKRDEHEPIMFECDQCEFITNIKNEFNSHLKQHCGIVSNYSCTDCRYTTESWTDYQKHLEEHDDLKRYFCDECAMVFRQRVHLNRHKLYRHPEYNLPCEICGFVCTVRNPDLFTHIRQVHGKELLDIELKKIGGEYNPCDTCNAETFTKRDYRQHQKAHKRGRQEVKLACDYCEYITDSESRLRRHEMTHSTERPYQCAQCEYKASQKEMIIRHIRTRHNPQQLEMDRLKQLQQQRMAKFFENEAQEQAARGGKLPEPKSFTCKVCQLKVPKVISLWKHMKLQHSDQLLTGPSGQEPCPVCEHVSDNRKLLLGHLRKHAQDVGLMVSGSEVFSCMLCSFSSALRLTFYDHLRKKHKVSVMLKQDGTTGYFQETNAADLPPLPSPPVGRLPAAAHEAIMKERQQRSHDNQDREVVIIAGQDSAAAAAASETVIEETVDPAAVEAMSADAGGQIQLTAEQLATLASGDLIEIDGQVYKIEFATTTPAAPGSSSSVAAPVASSQPDGGSNSNQVIVGEGDDEEAVVIEEVAG